MPLHPVSESAIKVLGFKEEEAVNKQRWLRAWEDEGIKSTDYHESKSQPRETQTEAVIEKEQKIQVGGVQIESEKQPTNFIENVETLKGEGKAVHSQLDGSGRGFSRANNSNNGLLLNNYTQPLIRESNVDGGVRRSIQQVQTDAARFFPEINVRMIQRRGNLVDITVRDFFSKEYRLDDLRIRLKSLLAENNLEISSLKINGRVIKYNKL